MILTTREAADELGVTTARVRQLVAAGALRPLNAGNGIPARAHRFAWLDVADLQAARMSEREHADLDALAGYLAHGGVALTLGGE